MKTGPTIARGKSKQDYPTPWEFIRTCERRFGPIVFDLAASPENAKAPKFFTVADDSLSQSWHRIKRHRGEWFFLNPPFDAISKWAKKCAEESYRGAQILFLTPASIGANWFRDHVHRYAEVYALNGRIKFVGMDDPYPKDCILSVFHSENSRTGFDVWTWPDDVPDMNPENY